MIGTMKNRKQSFLSLFLIAIFSFVLCNVSKGEEKTSGLVALGATLKIVQSGFNGTEGPATDPDGNVYFTSKADQSIQKWSWKDGKVSLYRDKDGEAVGMNFDPQGRLVICEMGNGRLTRDDLNGNIEVLVYSYNGNRLRPNDVWIDNKGDIYFSSGGIYFLSADGKKLMPVTNDIGNANGVVGAPDGKTLYVGDTSVVYSYRIQSDGSLSDKSPFCNMQFSDGLDVDENGNVYVTGDKIYIYNTKAELLEEIVTPERPKNINFAGKDRKMLFITCPNNIYTLEMTVKGAQNY